MDKYNLNDLVRITNWGYKITKTTQRAIRGGAPTRHRLCIRRLPQPHYLHGGPSGDHECVANYSINRRAVHWH